jgi:uncharacterized protein YcbK (DUF882 family)
MSRLTPALAVACALALGTSFATARPRPRSVGSQRVHVVYPGQTLAMIAKRYHVDVETLCKANGISRRSPIRPKQRLVIPSKDGVIPAALEKRIDPPEEKKAQPSAKAADDDSKPTQRDAKSKSFTKKPRRRGVISLQSYTGSFKGRVTKKGKIIPKSRTAIEKVMASWRTGQHQAINDRLLRLVVKVSDHFGGRPIRVVSGYRPYSPSQYTPHSRHNTGHAIDFSIPGVPNTVVRDYCRTLPNVGCGYYPNSSFIHMDARESSAYWTDFAGPGQAPRYADAQGRDPGEAQRADEEHEAPATGSGDGSHDGDDDANEPDAI